MFDGPISRRDAIRGGLAALAAATVPGTLRAKDDAFGGFKLAVQSYTFRKFSFEQGLLGASAKSVDVVGIEFPGGKLLGDPKKVTMRFDATYMKMAADGKL